jgi:hypothetical protein
MTDRNFATTVMTHTFLGNSPGTMMGKGYSGQKGPESSFELVTGNWQLETDGAPVGRQYFRRFRYCTSSWRLLTPSF